MSKLGLQLGDWLVVGVEKWGPDFSLLPFFMLSHAADCGAEDLGSVPVSGN